MPRRLGSIHARHYRSVSKHLKTLMLYINSSCLTRLLLSQLPRNFSFPFFHSLSPSPSPPPPLVSPLSPFPHIPLPTSTLLFPFLPHFVDVLPELNARRRKRFVLARISGQTEAKIRAPASQQVTRRQPRDGCCARERGGKGGGWLVEQEGRCTRVWIEKRE